jgi:hypothetical protein
MSEMNERQVSLQGKIRGMLVIASTKLTYPEFIAAVKDLADRMEATYKYESNKEVK